MWVPEVTLGRLTRTQADPGRVRDDGLDIGVPLLLYYLTTESSRAGGRLAHGGRRKPCCAPRAAAAFFLQPAPTGHVDKTVPTWPLSLCCPVAWPWPL